MSDFAEEFKEALNWLAGSAIAGIDQAQAMTDAELGALLLSGRWTTIEVHEAGRRLQRAKVAPSEAGGNKPIGDTSSDAKP